MITDSDVKKLEKHFATKAEMIAMKTELRQEFKREIGFVRQEIQSLREDIQHMAASIIEALNQNIHDMNRKLETNQIETNKNTLTIHIHEHRWTQFRTLASTI